MSDERQRKPEAFENIALPGGGRMWATKTAAGQALKELVLSSLSGEDRISTQPQPKDTENYND